MNWIVLAVLVPVFYFGSSGAAFLAMYRWPDAFPNRLASRFYAPLEWLARPSRQFNGIHWWCYPQFVNDYRKGSAPTPPRPVFELRHNSRWQLRTSENHIIIPAW